MKTNRKMLKAYDRRQNGHEATVKTLDSKQAKGFRRPGSRNPRKNGA